MFSTFNNESTKFDADFNNSMSNFISSNNIKNDDNDIKNDNNDSNIKNNDDNNINDNDENIYYDDEYNKSKNKFEEDTNNFRGTTKYEEEKKKELDDFNYNEKEPIKYDDSLELCNIKKYSEKFNKNDPSNYINKLGIINCKKNNAIRQFGFDSVDNVNTSIKIKCCGPTKNNLTNENNCENIKGKKVNKFNFLSEIGKLGNINCPNNKIITSAGINDNRLNIRCCPLNDKFKIDNSGYSESEKVNFNILESPYYLHKFNTFKIKKKPKCENGYYATGIGINNDENEYTNLSIKCKKIKCQDKSIKYPCFKCPNGEILRKGKCVSSCGGGLVLNNGKCESICNIDQKFDEKTNKCRYLCPNNNFIWPGCVDCKYGYEMYDNNCVPLCSKDKIRGNSGMCIYKYDDESNILNSNDNSEYSTYIIGGIFILITTIIIIIIIIKRKNK
jgi:hypothetical protein